MPPVGRKVTIHITIPLLAPVTIMVNDSCIFLSWLGVPPGFVLAILFSQLVAMGLLGEDGT
jgi:hypothetical protein